MPSTRLAVWPALRTLVARVLRRGDRAGAASLLTELLALVPGDARSLINLAALRAEAGDRAEASALVARAIEIARRRGEAVPAEWLSFASAR
jgi:Flp pilus assembly protein TadD